MAYRRKEKRVIPRPTNLEFIIKLLEKNSNNQRSFLSNLRKWVIFGGFVRDMMMGFTQVENDIDICLSVKAVNAVITNLEEQERLLVDYGVEDSITNTIYPVRRIVADLPEDVAEIDMVNISHPMFNVCDFTVNNLMFVNKTLDINARVMIKGKTCQETLVLCMSDIHNGLLRFMMPAEIPCSCREHFNQTPSQDMVAPFADFRKSCTQCALVLLEQQLKLVERLNKMLKKTHPETGEKLFRLADEPNFPSYFPQIVEKEKIQDDEICPICQEVFHQREDTIITTCGHKYCAECMYNHVMSSTEISEFGRRDSVSCPACREKVVLKTLGDLPISLEAAEEEESPNSAHPIDWANSDLWEE